MALVTSKEIATVIGLEKFGFFWYVYKWITYESFAYFYNEQNL
jgi:hypothetical protein